LDQILHKGKVLFPAKESSTQEVSAELQRISDEDWAHKKPSLLVMGTRAGEELKEVHEGFMALALYFVTLAYQTFWVMLTEVVRKIRGLPPAHRE
jgi:hypothetical protein